MFLLLSALLACNEDKKDTASQEVEKQEDSSVEEQDTAEGEE